MKYHSCMKWHTHNTISQIPPANKIKIQQVFSLSKHKVSMHQPSDYEQINNMPPAVKYTESFGFKAFDFYPSILLVYLFPCQEAYSQHCQIGLTNDTDRWKFHI